MKLKEQLRQKIRAQRKSDATFEAYWFWVNRFLKFARQKRGEWVHPAEMGERQVEIFLSHLANVENVAASTQNQAFYALCYLYEHVLNRPLQNVSAMRAKVPQGIREVVDQSELVTLFANLKGTALLVARMMYACNFRIGEVGRIRVKDVSFERRQIAVRNGKGEKSRVVGFPEVLHAEVSRQMESAKVVWRGDVADGLNGVSLPKAYGRKSASSHLAWEWWYLFPAASYSKCPYSGRLLRHHIHMGHIARQIKQAARAADIPKHVTSHCLRHSYATHSLENGVPIHVVQQLMGHKDISTTETYLHVTKDGATSAKSPLESLPSSQVNEALVESLANPKSVTKGRPALRIVG